jgi:hypothetical protein
MTTEHDGGSSSLRSLADEVDARVAAGVSRSVARREARRADRAERAERRRAGLEARHAEKLRRNRGG